MKWEAKSYRNSNKCYVVDENGMILFEEISEGTGGSRRGRD